MPDFDAMDDQYRRQREDDDRMFAENMARQRADLERARTEGEREHELRARERELERLQHEFERRRERLDRQRERERDRAARHEERRARHEERRQMRFGRHGFDINVDIDPDEIARSVSAAFVGMDDDAGDGGTFDETIEKTFTVTGMPRLRVSNVSGETSVKTGDAGQITVVARKRVRGGSADRAKRLLENVEVRIEQKGNDIYVEPHLYEQERSWLDLFRGKKFRVDFDITVPRECAVDAQTVSGDLSVSGTRGPARVESVSGDVDIKDLQGPIRVKSVSGDVQCVDYVGLLEGSSVSGDVDVRGRVRGAELHTVSGDISIELEADAARESRLKTISGDIDLGLLSRSCTCDFQTASGDLECDVPARIVREGRKDRRIVIGEGAGRLHVKTVSGDLTIRNASSEVTVDAASASSSSEAAPGAEAQREAESDPERTAPMTPPAAGASIRDLLERVARGEVDVDEAAAKLDENRRGF